ncbi:MAG: LPS export ABC transporter ATP-binding protein [Spirochaetes bacterium]|jgi:lipopolysaccharide export system ATP-binding protein|nr:LPS export ABC transporter ATP-binding protein [Spirochaetota bacterium]NLJ05830.1 LPS export ABC transporter ATP-binding protein [Exilispira sp.]MBP8991082.1 LPS export ABC transporter ATP-binding protein [Spirochaetota bacterium]HOV46858.1 LPS export ABC transporter ATP-binding protein [Exilispira sp.]HPB47002.1 LPS export ABC transporter ATP-binding protein [Exilispira sp.]
MELSVENLIKSFNKRVVVDEVSLHITKKEIVGLLGPNGAGKSTIFYMMVGFLKPLSGNIYLNGENITSLPMHKRARMGLGYLPQQPSIFRNMSVQDNIIAVLELRKDLNKKQMHEICDNLLEEFSISHLRKQSGHTLSGGERRRVEIARALANEPDFLLLDEPFAGVDPIAVKELQEIINKIRLQGLGIIITDHNVRETLKITDRSYIINHGKILIEGDTQTLINSEEARRIYLGSDFEL